MAIQKNISQKFDSKKPITREEAETLAPSKGMAANDGVIINDRIEHGRDIQSAGTVKAEISKTQSDIVRIAQMYKGVDLSQAMNDLAQDKQSLQILSQKNVYQNLMQGEVVQVRNVSRDGEGKPRHFFGVKLYQLDKQVNSNIPVLKLGFSTFDSVKLPESKKGLSHSLTVDPRFDIRLSSLLKEKTHTNDTQTKELVREIKETLTSNATSTQKAHKLSQQLNNVGDFYLSNDPKGKKQFLDESGKLFVLEQKQKVSLIGENGLPGGIHKRKHEIPVTDLPIKYKGVQLTEKQVHNLLIGNPIELSGLKDPKLDKPYSATVNLNLLSGKVGEADKANGIELPKGNNIDAKKSLLNSTASEGYKTPEQAKKLLTRRKGLVSNKEFELIHNTYESQNILTLDYILETYGPDALEPQFIPSREDDGEDIFIPKIRGDMSFEDWLLLPQEFRLFVTQIFIMKFQ